MSYLIRLKLSKREARLFTYMYWDAILGVNPQRPMLLTMRDYRRLEAALSSTNRTLTRMHKKAYEAYLKGWKANREKVPGVKV